MKPGLLVSMIVPEHQFNVWSIDISSGLPSSQGYDIVFACIYKFTKSVRLIPCFKGEGALSATECANVFFSHIVRLFGVPKIVLYEHDKR